MVAVIWDSLPMTLIVHSCLHFRKIMKYICSFLTILAMFHFPSEMHVTGSTRNGPVHDILGPCQAIASIGTSVNPSSTVGNFWQRSLFWKIITERVRTTRSVTRSVTRFVAILITQFRTSSDACCEHNDCITF